MHTTFGFYDLLETFPKPGCAVCNLLLRDVNKFLETLLFAFVKDVELQNAFRGGRGLCDQHGWALTKAGTALGIAALYKVVVDDLIAVMDENTPNNGGNRGIVRRFAKQSSGLANALEPTKPCMACAKQQEHEARYIAILREHFGDERVQSAYRGSDGLCLEHFKMTARAISDGDHARELAAIQREIWVRLSDELEEYMRKSDFQNADEKMGAEGNSWLRAVARLGGEHGVFGLRLKG